MSKIHIDLTEELEVEVKAIFEATCDEVEQLMGVLYSDVEAVCTETAYEPFVTFANSTISQFQEEVKSTAEKIFNEWKDGNGSFLQRAQSAKAGEEAEETARRIEMNIEDRFADFWTLTSWSNEISVDTSHPHIEDEDFVRLKDSYEQAANNIIEVGKNNVAKINELAEDNPSYEHVIPPIRSIVDVVGNNLKAVSKKFKEFEDQSKEISKQQSQIDKDAAQGAVSSAKQAAEFDDMFNDIIS